MTGDFEDSQVLKMYRILESLIYKYKLALLWYFGSYNKVPQSIRATIMAIFFIAKQPYGSADEENVLANKKKNLFGSSVVFFILILFCYINWL